MRRIVLVSLLLAAALSAAGAGAPPAVVAPADVAPTDIEFQVRQARRRQVIDRALKSYLFIGGGSGAIISADGYVITNNHVAARSRAWRVKDAAGRSYVADVVGLAPGTDLALLKIRHARNLPFLPLGDSDKLAVGETVFAIGNPFAVGTADHTPSVTAGIVSAVSINGPFVGDAIATDTPINPGNSGGPLINRAGELVGVNYGQMPSRFGLRVNTGSGYAVSSNQVRRFLAPLKNAKGGRVQTGSINGATFDGQPDGRVLVRQVEPDSPAARAGLAPGDRVVAVGPWPVVSLVQMYALTGRFPAGSAASLSVRRGRTRHELTVELLPRERVGLGVVLDTRNAASLKVERVVPGGPADRAGIRPGDVIRGIGPLRLRHRRVLQAVLARARPGQRLPLSVRRARKTVRMTVELAGLTELTRLARLAAATQPDAAPATQPADSPPAPPPPPTTQPAGRPRDD